MTLRWQRSLRFAVAMTIGLWFTQAPASPAEAASLEEEMLAAVGSLRSGTLAPGDAADRCVQALEASEEEADYRAVMATFLDVPRSEAIPALCRAIVQSIVAGTITEANLEPVLSGTSKDQESFEAGRLLRAVYFAHHLGSAPQDKPEVGQ